MYLNDLGILIRKINALYLTLKCVHILSDLVKTNENEYNIADQTTLFVSIGTSGEVYPAADFVKMFNDMKKPTVEFNLEPSNNQDRFDFSIYKPAKKAVEEFKKILLAKLT